MKPLGRLFSAPILYLPTDRPAYKMSNFQPHANPIPSRKGRNLHLNAPKPEAKNTPVSSQLYSELIFPSALT